MSIARWWMGVHGYGPGGCGPLAERRLARDLDAGRRGPDPDWDPCRSQRLPDGGTRWLFADGSSVDVTLGCGWRENIAACGKRSGARQEAGRNGHV